MGCSFPASSLFCTWAFAYLQIHHFCGRAEAVSDLKQSVVPPQLARASFETQSGRAEGLQEKGFLAGKEWQRK